MESTDIKKIPLNDLHEKLGAKIIPFAGYLMPVRYSSDIEEHTCVRNNVGVFDVSHMGEFIISGSGALPLIQKISANDASQLFDGRVQYSYMPNEEGGVVDDLLIYRLKEDYYYLVVNASNIEKDWNWIMKHQTEEDVEMQNVSENTCLFAIQGPKATETLQKLTEIDLSNIPYYHFRIGKVAGIELMISATGYTGAGGFELYVANEHAETLWNAIFEAGAEFGIKPIGLGARDTLRLEMGYCLYGNDITDETSPLEAGLGWVTKFTKNFVNSTNLKAQKEAGINRKLVGLEMIDKGIPRSHYEICDATGKPLGSITSGTLSPTLQKGIAMGYVPLAYSKTGTEVFIKVRDKLLKAMVVKTPFVKAGV